MEFNKEKIFVSCVIYLHNNEDKVEEFFDKVCTTVSNNFEKYELICVNDCCTDATIAKIKSYLKTHPGHKSVSLINLSFYQGVENAMNAGRDLAVGDFLFEFDSCIPDFNPSLIMDVYFRSLEGYDIVSAAPKNSISLSSKLFYAVYNLGTPKSAKICHERFRIISRRAINRINQMNIYIPYRKSLYLSSGLKADSIKYDNIKSGKLKISNAEKHNRSSLAVDTLIIFTDIFEKLSMILSVVFFFALLVMAGYLVYSIFSKTRPVEGWLSIMSLMSFGFFMVSAMLTLIFKYLSVILGMNFKKQHYTLEGVEKL